MSELQNLATFLLADGCEWLNGETITVDGAEHLVSAAASTICAHGATSNGASRAMRSAPRTRRIARRAGLEMVGVICNT